MEYNPSSQICMEDVVLPKCGDSGYIPAKEFCVENNIYSKCDGKEYDTDVMFCDTRDDKLYRWVKIGTQTWMAENLNYDPETGNSWCYGEDLANCDTYGRLYDWAGAMNFASSCNEESCLNQIQAKHQGACYTGWHLPTNAEWTTLAHFIGGSTIAGTKLKSATGWNGTDDYGFNALPGGDRLYVDGSFCNAGRFCNVGSIGYWWTATEGSSEDAYRRHMYSVSARVGEYNGSNKSSGYSVRCVKDN